MDPTKDYYAILGVLPSADDAIIKAVYRALAKKWHPDTFVGDKKLAEQQLKEINEAYGVLCNATSRADYDARRNASSGQQQQREYEEPDAADRASFEAERAADWKFVLQYYPNVEKMRMELALFSSALALTFQVILLELKAFSQANIVRQDLIKQFLRTYFGSSPTIQDFALRLIQTSMRSEAKELNRLIRLSGTPSEEDAKRIIELLERRIELQERRNRDEASRAARERRAAANRAEDEKWERESRARAETATRENAPDKSRSSSTISGWLHYLSTPFWLLVLVLFLVTVISSL